MQTPKAITANGTRWTFQRIHEDGYAIYQRGRTVQYFDAWEMERVNGAGLLVEWGAPGKKVNRTLWRAEA